MNRHKNASWTTAQVRQFLSGYYVNSTGHENNIWRKKKKG